MVDIVEFTKAGNVVSCVVSGSKNIDAWGELFLGTVPSGMEPAAGRAVVALTTQQTQKCGIFLDIDGEGKMYLRIKGEIGLTGWCFGGGSYIASAA